MKKVITLFAAITCVFTIYAQITESGNGFEESFDYADGIVFDDVEYEGAFVEWPENSSVQNGILTWDMGVEGEGSFGAEFKDSLDLTGNTNLQFKYKFPADAFVDIYMIDADGKESELSVTFFGGVDTLQEITLDLSTATGLEGGEPADLSTLKGFFIIFFTPTESTLCLDDVLLGDALITTGIITNPITESGNGFEESFDYADGIVFDDVEYEGAFVEWPENSSVQNGILTWDMGVEGEGSFGAEFKDSLDLTGNTNLQFKYKFPADAFVDIYMIDADGKESELSVTFFGGVDTLQEITLDLSAATGLEGGEPADLSTLKGFFIIFFTPTESTLCLDDVLLGDALIPTGIITNPITESGNGFEESFDYADGIVFDDVEYEGAFVEWPENSSVQNGILTWDMDVEGEGSFGAEFKDSMNLTGNTNLQFKYKFPADAFVDIYMIDAEGKESELSVNFIGGVDTLQEITLDLSDATGLEGGEPADLSTLKGFFIIFFTPTESTLCLDDILLGDAVITAGIITNPITESGNGFEEPFDYPDNTIFDDVQYEGAFVEWPENSSVQNGILTWDMDVEGEGSFGAEFKDSMNLTENTNLQFKYKFPADAFVDIYMIDANGKESELSVTFVGGVDVLQEITLDLSTATGLEGGEPADLSTLKGFFIIFFTPTGGTLCLDDVMLGDAVMTTGTSNHRLSWNPIRIYPNPATVDFRIDMDAELISIFNIAGQIVYKERKYNRGSSINISGLKSGMYIIQADKNQQKLIIR